MPFLSPVVLCCAMLCWAVWIRVLPLPPLPPTPLPPLAAAG